MRRIAVPLALTRQAAAPRGGRAVALDGPTMGVRWTLRALAPDGVADAAIAKAVQGAVDAVVRQMSGWEPTSDLSRFNRAPAGAWVAAPADLITVTAVGLELARASGGAFDPTLGHLVDLWGFGAAGAVAQAPDPGALTAARAGWGELEIDVAGGRLRQPGGLALDLSGIAKGFGVDQASRALDALGVRDHLIEIGGELRGAGVKGQGEPWWVEIEQPPGAPPADAPILVSLHGLSIATSGDWRRSFAADGRRYSHTLDPRTRRPVSEALAAVSVLHPDCLQADALCTALMVLGEAGLAFAADRGIAARFLYRDGLREQLTPALEAMLA